MAATGSRTTRELFGDWKTWAAETGERTRSENEFVEALKHRGFERWQHLKSRRMGFRGLELRDDFATELGAALEGNR